MAGWRPTSKSYYQLLSDLGLTSGLKVCLDAGSSSSYSTGQTWSDLSGNSTNFYRGDTSSSEATDPTFTGTAGNLATGTYWSFDGGDHFTLTASNPTWINNLHKDNAKFTMIALFYSGDVTTQQYVFCTHGNQATNVGTGFRIIAAGSALSVNVYNGSGSAAMGQATAAALSNNTWYVLGLTIDEAAGTGILQINSAFETFTSTYTSPSTSAASFTAALAGNARNTNNDAPNGSRMGAFMAWEGVALTQTQMLSVYNAVLSYTLGITVQSYTYTPVSVLLKRALKVVINPASYTYSAVSVLLKLARKLAIQTASYTYSPVTILTAAVLTMAVSAASYTFSTVSAALTRQVRSVIQAASYSVSTVGTNLTKAVQAAMSAASYAVSAVDVSFSLAALYTLLASTATYSVTAVDVALKRAVIATMSAVAYTVTAIDASFSLAAIYTMLVSTASYAVSGTVSLVANIAGAVAAGITWIRRRRR